MKFPTRYRPTFLPTLHLVSVSGVVYRESGKHQRASQSRHREHSVQKSLPADRAAGQRRAGGQPELQTASSAVEELHVPQQDARKENAGTRDISTIPVTFLNQVFLLSFDKDVESASACHVCRRALRRRTTPSTTTRRAPTTTSWRSRSCETR